MTPDELKSLMATSVVKTASLRNVTGNAPASVSFKITGDEGSKNGSRIPVYSLNLTDKNAQSGFQAYVCNYKQGEINYAFLGNDAIFMFTITMNGCTFGIGMPNPSGDVLVCHGNKAIVGEKTPQQQAAEQLSQVRDGLLEQTGQSAGMVLKPEQYRTDSRTNSTTFGIRESGAWKFWMHRYRNLGLATNGAKYEWLGTKEIVGSEFALSPV
jgi:hypothetical protein